MEGAERPGKIAGELPLATHEYPVPGNKNIIKYDLQTIDNPDIDVKTLNSILGTTYTTKNDVRLQVIKELKPQELAAMDKQSFHNVMTDPKFMNPVTKTPAILESLRGAHVSAIGAAGDIDKLNELQDAITALDPAGTPASRKAKLAQINSELAKDVSSHAGQFGINFGKETPPPTAKKSTLEPESFIT